MRLHTAIASWLNLAFSARPVSERDLINGIVDQFGKSFGAPTAAARGSATTTADDRDLRGTRLLAIASSRIPRRRGDDATSDRCLAYPRPRKSDRPALAGSGSGSRAADRRFLSLNKVPPWASSSATGPCVLIRHWLHRYQTARTPWRFRRIAASVDDGRKGPSERPESLWRVARGQFLDRRRKVDDTSRCGYWPWRPLDCLTQLIHAGGTSGQDACGRQRSWLEFLHSRFQARLSSSRVAQNEKVGTLKDFRCKS